MSMKNSNDTTRSRTHDLPACSTVPQPTAPPRAPTRFQLHVYVAEDKYVKKNNIGSCFVWIWNMVFCCEGRIWVMFVCDQVLAIIFRKLLENVNLQDGEVDERVIWRWILTHWHTQPPVRWPGSLGPLIHSRLWDGIQRPTQHHSTTGVCTEVNKN